MPPLRLIAWARRDQDVLVREAVAAADATLVAIGGATAADRTVLGQSLDVPGEPDLRVAMLRDDADVIWLADATPLDADALRAASERTGPILCTEPRPGSMAELTLAPDVAAAGTVVPLLRDGAAFRGAHDALTEIGAVRAVNVVAAGTPEAGSLYARLYDALDVVLALCGEPDGVDAARTSVPGTIAPEDLRDLTGHLTATLRYGDARCAALTVTDRAGSWLRSVTVIGEHGVVRISDRGSTWFAPDAEPTDSRADPRTCSPGVLTGLSLRRAFDGAGPPASVAPDPARTITLAEAARLSCRTGQTEAPDRLLAMLGRV